MSHLSSKDLLALLANRRSYYKLNSTLPIPTSRIHEILTSITKTVPSAFNSQTTRMILLLNTAHHTLWDITARVLRTHMGESRWSTAPTASKLAGFRGAAGTILFFEDTAEVEAKKHQFTSYAEHWDAWSEQTGGMHQLAVWVALEAEEGIGANLQHYNSVVDLDVKKEFDVPAAWKLRAQLVFGGIEGGRPEEKEKKDEREMIRVIGADEEGK